MAFIITEFQHNLSKHNETARGDKFDVFITIPQLVGQTNQSRDLSLQCEASELPARDIATIDFRHYSFIKRVPHFNQYGLANFTFIVTGDMWEKKMFDRWMDIMIPTATGLVAYPLENDDSKNYETTIKVNQYNMSGDLVYQVELIDAFPTSVSALNQSWDNDSIHKLSVSFQFLKWQSDQTSAGKVRGFGGSSSGSSILGLLDNISNKFNGTNLANLDQRVPQLSSITNEASSIKNKLTGIRNKFGI